MLVFFIQESGFYRGDYVSIKQPESIFLGIKCCNKIMQITYEQTPL